MTKTSHSTFLQQALALIEGVPHLTANLANISALIWQSFDDINWAGFYLEKDGRLVLGPFQGRPACIEIPYGKGVCGSALKEDKTFVVPDVHKFEGHIACDSRSLSEIVVPIHKNGLVKGVIDIDSPLKGRFTEEDRRCFERLAVLIENIWPD